MRGRKKFQRLLLVVCVSTLAAASFSSSSAQPAFPGRPSYYQGGPAVRISDGGTDARDAATARQHLDVPGRGATETITGNWTFTGSLSSYGSYVDVYDAAFRIHDSSDTSKVGRFELGGLPTATTRVWTLPNATGTIPLLESSQDWTGVQNLYAFGSQPYLRFGYDDFPAEINSGQLITRFANPGSASYVWTLPNKTGELVVGASGVAVAVRGDLLVGNSTPAWSKLAIGSSGKYLRTNGTDPSWAAITAGDLPTVLSTGTVLYDPLLRVKDASLFLKDDSDTTKKLVLQLSPISTGATRTWTAPNADITVAGIDFAQTWTANQTFSSTTFAINDGTGSVTFDASGLSTSRQYTWPDVAGTPVVRVGAADLTGQTAAIGSTSIATAPGAGQYEVTVYALCTTASGSGTPTLACTIGYTDNVGATTQTAFTGLSLSATGRTAPAPLSLRVASGNITYTTTITGASGSPQYALYIKAVRL